MNLIELGWDSFFIQHFEQFRNEGFSPARIACEQRQIYLIYTERGELSAEVSGKFRHNTLSRYDFPAVGDWVAVKIRAEEGRATIHAILPRKSHFSRKTAGELTEEQVIAANIDTLFLVNGLDRDFNLRRIERYLTLAWDSGANPVIVLNKADLCRNIEERMSAVESIAFGIPLYSVSAIKNQGLDALRKYISRGKTIALLGSSGVGKSTIINSLLGVNRQSVNHVREKNGRGRHITSFRELILVPTGGMIIDNPGMRELQLWTEEDGLQASFEDIEELAQKCRFRNCQHEHEPGCAVRKALEMGELDSKRFQNYLKLKKEYHYLIARKDQKARLAEKTRWKRISQWSKQMKKYNQKGGR